MIEYSPYDILNIEGGITQKQLKMQYKRLIRRFTPEHHPQQFIKIRNAYDSFLKNDDNVVELMNMDSERPTHFPLYESVKIFFEETPETDENNSDKTITALTTIFETPFDTHQEVFGILEAEKSNF